MKRLSIVNLVVLMSVLTLFSISARAELIIEITEGVTDATSIAVVPFAWSGNRLPEDVAQIVSADLHRSGQFAPLDRSRMLSLPTDESQVFYRDWQSKSNGAEYLVIGKMSSTSDGKYRVDYQLFDIFQKKMVKKWYVSGDDLRAMAHYISDTLYKELTGVRGAFSTKMVYVTMEYLQEAGKRVQRYRLYLADVDGHNERIMLESSEPILSPSWAPNGRHITYVSFETTRPAIYIMDTKTRKSQKITGFAGLNGAPRFSPDGKSLAMVLSKDGNPEIYTMNLTTGKVKRITNHYAIDTEPAWSPDGESLIYTSERGGSPQIYRQYLDSGKVERLTFEGSYNARPVLTPDGRFLAMVHRSNGIFHIAVQDLVRGTFNVLTETDLDESPSIAPNASMIIYATTDKGSGVLAAVSLDGRVKVKLPSRTGDVREPAWSPFM
ncbi:Tol-Pal system beta propeller repeat protein TolB [Ketobacter nezhaii]|uniref:Tol-Pal system beta propeller repeat protein TolB n=1 Tax=Ketobacter sp. MCCC 1A13808 TaxID=2602738 RepID=UPI0012EC0175|nr:Tol-Pal system beta propeller repeat protein TolB [Ketobacter sp. MCCC 1A13808]